jgi:hypothetical protein
MTYPTYGHDIVYHIRELLCYIGVFKKYVYRKRSIEDLGTELVLLYFFGMVSIAVPRMKTNFIKY